MSCRVDVVGLRTLETVVRARIASLRSDLRQMDDQTLPSSKNYVTSPQEHRLQGGIDELERLAALLPELQVEVDRP